MGTLFDYRAAAKRLGLSAKSLDDLETGIRRQYGSDEMMFELRMLRTLQAVEEGAVTLADAIREFRQPSGVPPAGAAMP